MCGGGGSIYLNMQLLWFVNIAGCIGAGLTTPLDVAKTRIMLAEVILLLILLHTLLALSQYLYYFI